MTDVIPAAQSAHTVQPHGGLIFIGDGQGRCLLLTGAQGALALALMVRGRIQDESRHLRSKHVREFIRTTPLENGDLHLIRLDAEAALQEGAPVVTDAELTLSPAQQAAFVQDLLTLVPSGTSVSPRPADDLWSAA